LLKTVKNRPTVYFRASNMPIRKELKSLGCVPLTCLIKSF